MTLKMNAAVFTQYGAPEVLQTQSLDKPTPKDHEIRIKVHATAVNSGDCRIRRADPFAVRLVYGLFKPKKTVLGGVFSGKVEAVGKSVSAYEVGDEVFGSTMEFGAYAEYICVSEHDALAIKPENLSHQEAAALPFGGITALFFLQKANIQPGQKVLIYGASGAVGSAAVQIAKSLGAEVTGVCSTGNMHLVKSLGADNVIDYTQTDFSKNGAQYDVVYETVDKASFSSCAAAVKSNGTLILGASMLGGMLQGIWLQWSSKKKVLFGVALPTKALIQSLQSLAEAGKLKAAIDQTFPLEQMAAAHAYVDKGHKKGSVVISVI